jgi:hypothetical protein
MPAADYKPPAGAEGNRTHGGIEHAQIHRAIPTLDVPQGKRPIAMAYRQTPGLLMERERCHAFGHLNLRRGGVRVLQIPHEGRAVTMARNTP